MRIVAVLPHHHVTFDGSDNRRWHAAEQLPSGQVTEKTACGLMVANLEFDSNRPTDWVDWFDEADVWGRCKRCVRTVELRQVVGDEPERLDVVAQV
jgi:hypothetical protein